MNLIRIIIEARFKGQGRVPFSDRMRYEEEMLLDIGRVGLSSSSFLSISNIPSLKELHFRNCGVEIYTSNFVYSPEQLEAFQRSSGKIMFRKKENLFLERCSNLKRIVLENCVSCTLSSEVLLLFPNVTEFQICGCGRKYSRKEILFFENILCTSKTCSSIMEGGYKVKTNFFHFLPKSNAPTVSSEESVISICDCFDKCSKCYKCFTLCSMCSCCCGGKDSDCNHGDMCRSCYDSNRECSMCKRYICDNSFRDCEMSEGIRSMGRRFSVGGRGRGREVDVSRGFCCVSCQKKYGIRCIDCFRFFLNDVKNENATSVFMIYICVDCKNRGICESCYLKRKIKEIKSLPALAKMMMKRSQYENNRKYDKRRRRGFKENERREVNFPGREYLRCKPCSCLMNLKEYIRYRYRDIGSGETSTQLSEYGRVEQNEMNNFRSTDLFIEF